MLREVEKIDVDRIKTHLNSILNILDSLDISSLDLLSDFNEPDGRYNDLVEWLRYLEDLKV